MMESEQSWQYERQLWQWYATLSESDRHAIVGGFRGAVEYGLTVSVARLPHDAVRAVWAAYRKFQPVQEKNIMSMIPCEVGQTRSVANIPDTYDFVNDSQDVEAVQKELGSIANGYDSFFVLVGDGDYQAVFGMAGIVPYLSKLVTRIA